MPRPESILRRFLRLDRADRALALEAAALLAWACAVVRWSSGRSLGRRLRREGAEREERTASHRVAEAQRRSPGGPAQQADTRENERQKNAPSDGGESRRAFLPLVLPRAASGGQLNAAFESLRLRVMPLPPPAPPPLPPLAPAAHLLRMTERVARLHPLRPLCLEEALAARWLLARHGHACTLVIGAKLPVFEAHAWLELEDEAVLEAPRAGGPGRGLRTSGVDLPLTSAAGYHPIWRA